MSDFDDLRNLFDRTVADAPDRPDRAATVAGRARRVRRRQRIAIAAAGTALLGGVAALVVPMLPRGAESGQKVITVDTTTPTPEPTPSATDSPPLPTPTPTPTVSATPTQSAPAVAPVASPTPTPTPTPTESLAYAVSTRLGSGAGTGYPLTVVTFHVTGLLKGDLIAPAFLFVDPNETIGYVEGPAVTCTNNPELRAFDRTFTFSYPFREATRYPVHLEFFSGTCGDHVGEPHEYRTSIDVTAGSTHTNGPNQPVLDGLWSSATVSGGQITVRPGMSDDDGLISQFTVDWGNGDAPVVIEVARSCADTTPGPYWPATYVQPKATSPVLASGSYTVTITVSSTGCDGSDPQSVSTSHTFTIPSA